MSSAVSTLNFSMRASVGAAGATPDVASTSANVEVVAVALLPLLPSSTAALAAAVALADMEMTLEDESLLLFCAIRQRNSSKGISSSTTMLIVLNIAATSFIPASAAFASAAFSTAALEPALAGTTSNSISEPAGDDAAARVGGSG
jgi:hypothetical protein